MIDYYKKDPAVKLLEDPSEILWTKTKLGLLPRHCSITGRWLWPFSVVAKKHLTYVLVGKSGIWNQCYYASFPNAMIENLKTK